MQWRSRSWDEFALFDDSGKRFVCNVLSIHSTKKVTSPKPSMVA